MVIISLEHAEPRIEGYLSRHMLKVRPGIFAGRLSKTRRDLLWEHIISEQPDIDAVMCYDAANYCISLQTHGNPKRHVVDVDGISLLAFPRPEAWKSLLAKPDKLLWEHSVETVTMAKIFLTESTYQSCLDLLYEQTDKTLSRQQFLHSLLFIIGLHDLGKLHPFFQENLVSKSSITDVRHGFRHEKESERQLSNYLEDNKHTKIDIKTQMLLASVVKDHHQGKASSTFEEDAEQKADQSKAYNENVSKMIDFMYNLHPFTSFKIIGEENLFGQILSGILRFSDWAASSYCNSLSSMSERYMKNCHEIARRFLHDGGLMNDSIPTVKYDFSTLCELSEDKLYPLQRKLIDVMKEHPQTECLLIEDQPGSGKTESAFYAAVQLMQEFGRQGLYIALPTDATASEMIPRLQRCFKDHGLFQDANAKLLTGKAWLYKNQGNTVNDEDKIEWETKSRKLFAPLACGTVDQLMQSGMNLKAGDLRLLALSNKVVIIDEFHAYDAYMMKIIKIVLKWLHAIHVPVIILSATLLDKTRQELFSIYSKETLENNGYPRVTCAENGHVYTYGCEPANHKKYLCQTIEIDDVVGKVIDSVKSGGNTLYIANTVKHAWKTFRLLQANVEKDVSVHLYTARTTPNNKENMGKQLVYLYGKEGKRAGVRPSKTIVVATQIMEMSVDVDFDTVFSELAPADALFQRMGRMARHNNSGTVREHGFQSVFYVVIPHKTQNWNTPYAESVLTGTEQVFMDYSYVSIPQDIPKILELSYKNAGDSWIKAEHCLAARVTGKTINEPHKGYVLSNQFFEMSEYSTRYQVYPMETIICLPQDEIIQDTYEWARNAILTYSVSAPEDLSKKLPSIHDTKKMKWLKDYKIIEDKSDYWGPDKQFIFGL